MRIKCNCILQLVSPPKQQNVNQNGICNTHKVDAVIHTGPWYQASVCERLVLSSVFGLVQSSRSTTHSRTCCYATSCRRQAVSNDHPRAGETWLSSDQQSFACPMMTTSETHSNSTIYETCNLQILATINTCRDRIHTNVNITRHYGLIFNTVLIQLPAFVLTGWLVLDFCGHFPFLMPSTENTHWTYSPVHLLTNCWGKRYNVF